MSTRDAHDFGTADVNCCVPKSQTSGHDTSQKFLLVKRYGIFGQILENTLFNAHTQSRGVQPAGVNSTRYATLAISVIRAKPLAFYRTTWYVSGATLAVKSKSKWRCFDTMSASFMRDFESQLDTTEQARKAFTEKSAHLIECREQASAFLSATAVIIFMKWIHDIVESTTIDFC